LAIAFSVGRRLLDEDSCVWCEQARVSSNTHCSAEKCAKKKGQVFILSFAVA
jgi:hypothetical protein